MPQQSIATSVTPFSSQVTFNHGLKGSLTQLANGNPFLVAGSNISISSAENGPITINLNQSSGGLSIAGNDGEVLFNNSGAAGADTSFKYNSQTKTMSVPSLRGRITALSDGVTPYLNYGGTLQSSTSEAGSVTLSRSDYSSSAESTGSTAVWRSYVPDLKDDTSSLNLSNSTAVVGRYFYKNNTLRLLFTLSSQSAQGALTGTGTYRITLPPGYEINTNLVPLGSPDNPTAGLALGEGTVQADFIGGGGSWTVLPLTSTTLALWGKNPAGTSIIPWGSSEFPLTAGSDLRVTFTAHIPAIRTASVSQSWAGPDVKLNGGAFTLTKGVISRGTQFVEGVLAFGAGTQIHLYESVFTTTGQYVLFDYSLGSFPGGQSQLNSNVTVVSSDLILSDLPASSGIAVLEDQPDLKRIILKLKSKPANGKQWINGNLAFAGATEMVLGNLLHATTGAYDLFEVTGTVTGLENLTVTHEQGLVGTPFLDPTNNKIVKITLA